MKRYSYILIVMLSGLLSCEKQPSMNPRMVNEFITGEVNGMPFKSGITVENGAIVRKDLCDDDVIGMVLARKILDDEFQTLYLNFFHTQPGDYTLTDMTVMHRKNTSCNLDSITATLYVKEYPGDDVAMDSYRLVKGPWNYFKVLYYDPRKNEMQGKFAAKFVRTNERRHGREAVDTITYTNSKFILSNIHIQEVFIEPR